MTGHTYLMKSRHGVYYLRQVRPAADSASTGKPRERRVSLRTKSRAEAKVRLLARLIELTVGRRTVESSRMFDDEEERDSQFHRGLELIEQMGNLDPHDEFCRMFLMDLLSTEDLKAYILAFEHKERQEARTKVRAEQLLAKERALANARLPGAKCPTRAPARSVGVSRAETIPSGAVPASANGVAADSTVGTAIDRFITHKPQVRKATTSKYRSQCEMLIKVIGAPPNKLLSTLSPEDLRCYVDTLPRLPRKVSPQDPRSIDTILGSAGPRISEKTRFSHARAVNMFLEWCVDQGYPVTGSFAGILKPFLKKPKSHPKEKSFTVDELRTIFNSELYREGLFQTDSDYWLPLLALFTGARQAELCQLECRDICRSGDGGAWHLDINDKGSKQIKQAASRRLVPVHDQLVTLGFVQFVDAAKARGSDQLFPDLARNPRGEFATYSKRFNRFLDALGIESSDDAKKDFHSFRHTLTSYLTGRGVEEYVVNAIVGHSQSGRSESVRTYSGEINLETKRDAIASVYWNVDFNRLAPCPALKGVRSSG